MVFRTSTVKECIVKDLVIVNMKDTEKYVVLNHYKLEKAHPYN